MSTADIARNALDRLIEDSNALAEIRGMLDLHRRDILPTSSEKNRRETDEECLRRILPHPRGKTRLLNALVNGDGIPLEVIIGWEGGSAAFVPRSQVVPIKAPKPLTHLRIGDVLVDDHGSRFMIVHEGTTIPSRQTTLNPDGTISLAPGVRWMGNVLEKS